MLARAYVCLALVCASLPFFVPCLVQMIGFEEAAATKTRYSDNDNNMPAAITLVQQSCTGL